MMDDRIAFLPPQKRCFHQAGYLLGFALGGFFDGIVLHQILQWHHLLSGIARAPFNELRIQILADGAFHASMYLVAALGMRKLLQARYVLLDRAADRLLAGNLLIGFGAWHVVDGIVSHWLLGIHRIRMDAADPLFWDVLWFALFGVLFIVAGIALRRRRAPPSQDDHERRRSRSTLAPLLIMTVTAAAIGSALPPAGKNGNTVTVLLRPDTPPVRLLAGLRQTDARIVWSSPRGDAWVLKLGKDTRALDLYLHGALYVSGSVLPVGCAAWLRA